MLRCAMVLAVLVLPTAALADDDETSTIPQQILQRFAKPTPSSLTQFVRVDDEETATIPQAILQRFAKAGPSAAADDHTASIPASVLQALSPVTSAQAASPREGQ